MDKIEKQWTALAEDCEMSLGPVDFAGPNCHWCWGQLGNGQWFISYIPSLYSDGPERVYILPAFIGEIIKATKEHAVEDLQQKIRYDLGIRR